MQQGAAMQTSIMENLYFTKKASAKYIVQMIGLFYDKPRILRVTHENGVIDKYALNQEVLDETGETYFYDIKKALDFDVILRNVPAFSTVRQMYLSTIAELAKAGAIPPEIAGELAVQFGEGIPDKQKLIQRLQQYYQAVQAQEAQKNQAEIASMAPQESL